MNNINNSHLNKITLVVTSCGRFDLLKKTLLSFIQHNTYKIFEVILVEDSGSKSIKIQITKLFDGLFDETVFVKLIFNTVNLGQVRSIDIAYSQVQSEYIFHLEDDWQFFRGGFIEEGLSVLESNPKALLHVVKNSNFKNPDNTTGQFYSIVNEDWVCSFNPSLRRTKDYKNLNKSYYTLIEEIKKNGLSKNQIEKDLTTVYKAKGYFSTFTNHGFCFHIGYHRHIRSSGSTFFLKLDDGLKKVKSRVYKYFGFGHFKKNKFP